MQPTVTDKARATALCNDAGLSLFLYLFNNKFCFFGASLAAACCLLPLLLFGRQTLVTQPQRKTATANLVALWAVTHLFAKHFTEGGILQIAHRVQMA